MRMEEVRNELKLIAHYLREKGEIVISDRVFQLAEETRKRKPISVAPRTSVSATPELQAKIRAFRKKNPLMAQEDIARKFGVRGGRVSEALRGKRK